MEKKSVWEEFTEAFPPSNEEADQAKVLVEEWEKKGCITKSNKHLLSISDRVIYQVFYNLTEKNGTEQPFKTNPHSGWMVNADFTFYNVRATGLGKDTGNFITASKLLLGEKNKAIHLAPFTRYEHGTIYAVVSTKTPSPEVWHLQLSEKGILPADQVRAFVQAAHSLGKAVGYDLEPHTAQFSYHTLENPGAFRWIKIYTPDPRWLDYLFTPDSVYEEENQARILREITVMMSEFFSQETLKTFDEEPGDTYKEIQRKHGAFLRGVNILIRTGYWPVPSHSWNGYGLPKFKGFNNIHHYAEFSYQDRAGVDTSSSAYHVVTPFNFWKNLPPQNSYNFEDRARSGKPNSEGIELYKGIFSFWRDEMEFDWIRFDSVDHIWDSCDPQNPAIPFSDRPTPTILRECILAARSGGHQAIGTLAERMGSEIQAYETLGFDLMLGSSMLENPGFQMWNHDLKIVEDLEELNRDKKPPFSVCYALDTHDTGNKHLRGKPLIELEGGDGMIFRLFLARFLFGGAFHRPVYSVMGLTDLSYGLFESNISIKNLRWNGVESFTRTYFETEALYELLSHILRTGQRTILSQTPAGASWKWKTDQNEIFCRISFPDSASQTQFGLEIFPDEEVRIYLPGIGWSKNKVETLPAGGIILSWRKIL